MMSILYGLQGSGKSYEGVKNYVLVAIKAGRRVVTNIKGLDPEKIYAYLASKGADPSKLGELVCVTNERVAEEGFFCGETSPAFKFDVPDWVPHQQLYWYAGEYTARTGKTFGKTAAQLLFRDLKLCLDAKLDVGSCLVEAAHQEWKNVKLEYFEGRPRNEPFAEIPSPGESVVKGGDLVIIDECWRYWDTSQKISLEHRNFFRMHRHYTREDGTACDVVGIIQDWDSLNRSVKGLVNFVVHFHKLKALGLMNRYRYDSFDGKPSRANITTSSSWQKYDPSIFPLYKSYDGVVGGKEVVTDSRQTMFSKQFILIYGVAAVVFVVGGIAGFQALAGMREGKTPGQVFREKAGLVSASASAPAGAASGPPGAQGVQRAAVPSLAASAAAYSGARLVGVVTYKTGQHMVMVQLADGRTVVRRAGEVAQTTYPDGRVAHNFLGGGALDGWGSWADIDGQRVSFTLQGVKK